MKIETIEFFGFQSVLRALRLPHNSHNKSDSIINCSKYNHYDNSQIYNQLHNNSDIYYCIDIQSNIHIGANDIKLMNNLRNAGDEHAKALRGLIVSAEITMARDWWQQFDTYNIGVTKLGSQSTMHTLTKSEILPEHFDMEIDKTDEPFINYLKYLNDIRVSDDPDKIVKLKKRLPEGYLQSRVDYFSYQTLQRIFHQRKHHKLPEWKTLIAWIDTLPLADILIKGKE